TTVIVEDGNMVVLGGLIDEDLQQSTQKVPILGDLPLIGGLFRSHSVNKIKRNLMVFLHPVIVRDAATETLISSRKYSYMRAKQLEQKAQGLPLMSTDKIPVLPDLDDFLTVLPGDENLTPAEIEPQLYKTR
ncbi:General secretion pathway protein D, partial [Candidatus Thiomargarita nelsonii]